MFKNYLLKKMLAKQGVPEEQIEMFIKMMERDPELFKKIAEEMQVKIKGGMDQMQAGQEVMKKYEEDLKKLI